MPHPNGEMLVTCPRLGDPLLKLCQKRAKSAVCGCSSMVERQLPKLHTWVRFPSPAPTT